MTHPNEALLAVMYVCTSTRRFGRGGLVYLSEESFAPTFDKVLYQHYLMAINYNRTGRVVDGALGTYKQLIGDYRLR